MEGAEFSAVLAWAAEFNWPVNLHVTDARGPLYPGRIETPREEFVRLARAWPNVTLVLAHWGGGEPRLASGQAGAWLVLVNHEHRAIPTVVP
jgi:predicted TIM-barrel fold metal-dependent hydrolase